MKSFFSLIAGALVLGATLVAPAAAQDATVHVIHGIRGQDLGLDPALPVDISVDGACALTGFTFGSIAGPLSLPAGVYDINIYLADPINPCSGTPVISVVDLPLAAGEDATIIAHLDAAGAPTASKFQNDVSRNGLLGTRIALHHTAAAPEVDARLRNLLSFLQPNSVQVQGLSNGEQAAAGIPFGFWYGRVFLAGTNTAVLGPLFLIQRPRTLSSVYVVGSAATGTLTAIVHRRQLQH